MKEENNLNLEEFDKLKELQQADRERRELKAAKRRDNALFYDVWYKVLWVLLALEIGYSLLHPRIRMIPIAILTLFFLADAKNVLRRGEAKRPLARTAFALIVYAAAVYYITFFLLSFQSWRAPYEYKGDITSLKATIQHIDFWPDAFPAGAKNKTYENLPSMLQGRGYIRLSFTIDEEYLQDVMSQYDGKALKGYAHGKYIDFVAKGSALSGEGDIKTEESVGVEYKFDIKTDDVSQLVFYDVDPLSDDFQVEEYSFVMRRDDLSTKWLNSGDIVYLLYSNGNWNHLSVAYIVIDPNQKRITYYYE